MLKLRPATALAPKGAHWILVLAQVVPLLEAAVEARTEIQKASCGNRELIYLDLALEVPAALVVWEAADAGFQSLPVPVQDVIRGGAERAAGATPRSAIRLVGPLLQNLCLTAGDNEEICFCLAAWLALPQDLRQGHHPSREAALQVWYFCFRPLACPAHLFSSID